MQAPHPSVGWNVRVPASTSNLGPGFDCLGLCLALHLDATVRPLEGAPDAAPHVVERTGEPLELDGAEDLLTLAFDRARRVAGAERRAMRFEIASEIPFGRGFGSSGAAVAAGLLLGAASAGTSFAERRAELERAGLELEGHPDNVIASLRGGATLGVPLEASEGGGLAVLEPDVHPSLGAAIAWPTRPLTTPEARRVLPESVPFAAAVENPRRLALLLAGLRDGDPRLLRLGSIDHLHERYRAALVPGAREGLRAALEAGAYSSHLSGAGSGLVALCSSERAATIGAALAGPLGPGARHRSTPIVREAPEVRALSAPR